MKISLVTFSVSLALLGQTVVAADTTQRDEFFWLSEINKASLVINAKEGLLPKETAGRIATGLQRVIDNGN